MSERDKVLAYLSLHARCVSNLKGARGRGTGSFSSKVEIHVVNATGILGQREGIASGIDGVDNGTRDAHPDAYRSRTENISLDFYNVAFPGWRRVPRECKILFPTAPRKFPASRRRKILPLCRDDDVISEAKLPSAERWQNVSQQLFITSRDTLFSVDARTKQKRERERERKLISRPYINEATEQVEHVGRLTVLPFPPLFARDKIRKFSSSRLPTTRTKSLKTRRVNEQPCRWKWYVVKQASRIKVP